MADPRPGVRVLASAPGTPPAADPHPPPGAAPPPPIPSAAGAALAQALAAFTALNKRGKPQAHEHTVLAAWVVERWSAAAPTMPPHYAVVALATGLKCLPAASRCPAGSVLNDCHAEVLAKRGLQAWLYGEAEGGVAAFGADTGGGAPAASVADPRRPPPPRPVLTPSGLFEVRQRADAPPSCLPLSLARTPHWRLHFTVTAAPCGDAGVWGDCVTGARALTDDGGATEPPSAGVEGRIDVRDQAVGLVRRKPGRGPPTASASCSDKLARWGVLGAQGALLADVLEAPLRPDCVTVCAGCGPATVADGASPPAMDGAAAAAALAALRRAVSGRLGGVTPRLDTAGPFAVGGACPATAIASLDGGHVEALGLAPSPSRTSPAGGALVWWRTRPLPRLPLSDRDAADGPVRGGTAQVLVGARGVLAGATKSSGGKRARGEEGGGHGAAAVGPPLPALSKAAMAQRWARLCAAVRQAAPPGRGPPAAPPRPPPRPPPTTTYRAAKAAAAGGAYAAAWAALRAAPSPLAAWPAKAAGLEEFSVATE